LFTAVHPALPIFGKMVLKGRQGNDENYIHQPVAFRRLFLTAYGHSIDGDS
jgi:hypothetical protein